MKIGLYFGSFNPIHIGHLIIAQHFLNTTELQQVWLVVSPQNPFKPSQTLLDEYNRLHLVRLAIGHHPQLKVSDIEYHLPKPSYTANTLTYLEEKFPQHEFCLLMGSDSWQNLPRWHNGTLLLKRYSIYIYERPGFTQRQGEINTNTIFLKAPMLDISATHIRKLIKASLSIQYLVPDIVKEEIEKNNYYK